MNTLILVSLWRLRKMPCREPISEAGYALSLKQPWAALLVYGYKCIEVRTWPTARRGPVLIHAARVPDPRPEVWSLVPAELDQAARLVGGILGAGDLIDCRTYRTADAFAADRARHLNDPRWFRQPALYGFVFADLTALPFRVYRGGMRFFPVAQHSIDPGTGPGDLFTNP